MKSIIIKYIRNKGNLLLPVAFFLLPFMTSCSDYLDVEPLTQIVEDKFWNEESDVESVMLGCYSSMQSSDLVTRMMCWGEFRSDNVTAGTNTGSNKELDNILKESITANNSLTKWSSFYKVINKCNLIISKAPDVAKADPNYAQSELNATIAEASALRDLCYFYLIRTFRDVPYYTTPYTDDSQQLAIPATKFDNVLDSLILDLESQKDNIVKKYPSNKTNYNYGRITQKAVYAMLCDMYLWKQDYKNSVKYADLVINYLTDEYQSELDKKTNILTTDKLIDGYPLISDVFGNSYGNAASDLFFDGCSKESIFEIVFEDDENQTSNSSIGTFYGNATTSPGYLKPSDFVTNEDHSSLDNSAFRDKYDTRYYENVYVEGTSTTAIYKYAGESAPTIKVSGSDITAAGYTFQPESHNSSNWIVYRLTDIMLMKAEALCQMCPDSVTNTDEKIANDSLLLQAYNIVCTVNSRSNCAKTPSEIKYADYKSKTLMTHLIMDERQRELMFEGKRWYDLVRCARRDGNTGYLVTCASRKGGDGASAVPTHLAKMDAMYWPYNLDEMKVNPYLEQNPAFSSGENESYKKN